MCEWHLPTWVCTFCPYASSLNHRYFPPWHVMVPDAVTLWCMPFRCFRKSNWDKSEDFLILFLFFFFTTQIIFFFGLLLFAIPMSWFHKTICEDMRLYHRPFCSSLFWFKGLNYFPPPNFLFGSAFLQFACGCVSSIFIFKLPILLFCSCMHLHFSGTGI